jgi:4-aminobutyrate aminotransferase/(S)-3-amino-2-methylpropionate transaminase
VDGNSFIDFASGIAVTGVGGSAPAVEQADAFTHTCFLVTPYEGYVEVCERTPGDQARKGPLLCKKR